MEAGELWLAVAIPTGSDFDPEPRIREEIEARGSTSQWIEAEAPVPSEGDDEAFFQALAFGWEYRSRDFPPGVRQAAPWPRGRCDLCGAERPPHLPGCPYRTR
jgi:hypothetical protein